MDSSRSLDLHVVKSFKTTLVFLEIGSNDGIGLLKFVFCFAFFCFCRRGQDVPCQRCQRPLDEVPLPPAGDSGEPCQL